MRITEHTQEYKRLAAGSNCGSNKWIKIVDQTSSSLHFSQWLGRCYWGAQNKYVWCVLSLFFKQHAPLIYLFLLAFLSTAISIHLSETYFFKGRCLVQLLDSAYLAHYVLIHFFVIVLTWGIHIIWACTECFIWAFTLSIYLSVLNILQEPEEIWSS